MCYTRISGGWRERSAFHGFNMAKPRDIIATREYGVVGHPRQRVVVEIEQPVKAKGRRAPWVCACTIRGLGEPMTTHAHGVDAFQALELVLLPLRVLLERHRDRLTLFDGPPGILGLDLTRGLFGHSLELETTIEHMIEHEHRRRAKTNDGQSPDARRPARHR
jgi:hypothetical protein